MNHRGKHKKFQTGGPKIDPKVVEQMNKYMSGNNGDIQSRFALDTRVAIANDPVKIKERKKENTKKNYQNLRRVPNLKLYGDKELQMLADKPKDQWPEHVRNSLDNLESDEQRVMMHPDFDRNRPVSEQMELNRDNSLRTRVLRGRNTFMNSSGIPIVSDIAKMVAAPGSSFANLTMDAENQYVKPGVKQGLFNLGIDLLNVAPTETVGLANKSINTVKEVINKSTENGILSNAHKLNPFAFKPNSEMMYRGIGKEGMEDALESGVFRAKQNVAPIMDETGRFDMSKQFQGTYYSPKFNTADQYGAGYIAEVPKDVTDFRLRYKGKGNKTWSQIADENIPIDKGKILKKDWLQGYKQVEVPKTTQNFKSEIDWGAWNSEIPSNQALMQEYNAIEQTTKANGTWMKNLDGSPFQGTPEQFIQQNSQNFKKAFPNPIKDEVGNIQINYHGQRVGKPFNVFKQSERGNHGKGNYTFAGNRERALKFANDDEKRLYELYINSNNPQETIPSVFDESFNSISGRLQPEFDYLKVGKEQVTPQSNYLKSAVGNNGMFDMSNPNIYKALVPATVGAGILSQQEKPKKGFKEGGETMNYRGKKCMECGDNPKMQTAGEMQCPQGYTSDGYGNCIPDEPKKFNMYTVPEQTPDEMAALSKFGDWWKRGRPNQFKTTGNEGTDANPMGRGPVDTGPEKTPEKPKYNPFLLMRGVSTAASFLSNAVARKAQNNYDYSEQTALGQMNPIPVDQFQPTYNNMYAQQGGMMNPFSIYARYGGNLKSIIKDYNKFSNNAQMDMGDGKVDDQGMMAKGGTYNLPDEYAHDMLRELLHMGRMGHQNFGKGTKPMRGKMQGGGDISSLVPNKSRIKEQYLLNEQEKRKAELAKYAGREVVQATPTLTPYEQKLHDVQRLQRNAEFVLHNSDYTMNQFGDLGKSDKYYFNQSPTGKMVNRIPHVLKGMLDASIVADAPGLLYKGLKYGIGKLGQGASKVGIDELGMFTKQGDKQIYELNNGFGDLNNTPTFIPTAKPKPYISSKLRTDANMDLVDGKHLDQEIVGPWARTTNWKEFGDEMRGLMKRENLNPTSEADVEKFRKLWIESQNHWFMNNTKPFDKEVTLLNHVLHGSNKYGGKIMKKGGHHMMHSKHMMPKKHMDMDMDECPTCKDNDIDEMAKGGNWLRGAVNPDHKGWCTPLSNPHCTGHRRAFALMMKKKHGFHQMGGKMMQDGGQTGNLGKLAAVLSSPLKKWETMDKKGDIYTNIDKLPLKDESALSEDKQWLQNWIGGRETQAQDLAKWASQRERDKHWGATNWLADHTGSMMWKSDYKNPVKSANKMIDLAKENVSTIRVADDSKVNPNSYIDAAYGEYSPSTHRVFFATDPSKETIAHELTHGSKLANWRASSDYIDSIRSNDQKYKSYTDTDKRYLGSNTEIYSRIMGLRRGLDLKPDEPINKDILKEKMQNKPFLDTQELFNYLDEDSIIKLLNNLVKTDTNKNPIAKKGGLTPNKAREILHDGTAQGHPLTDKQRRFFGAMSKGNTMNYRGHKK